MNLWIVGLVRYTWLGGRVRSILGLVDSGKPTSACSRLIVGLLRNPDPDPVRRGWRGPVPIPFVFFSETVWIFSFSPTYFTSTSTALVVVALHHLAIASRDIVGLCSDGLFFPSCICSKFGWRWGKSEVTQSEVDRLLELGESSRSVFEIGVVVKSWCFATFVHRFHSYARLSLSSQQYEYSLYYYIIITDSIHAALPRRVFSYVLL